MISWHLDAQNFSQASSLVTTAQLRREYPHSP